MILAVFDSYLKKSDDIQRGIVVIFPLIIVVKHENVIGGSGDLFIQLKIEIGSLCDAYKENS